MKFKTLALAAVFFFATGVNAELATEENSINFRKTSGAEQNLADAKDAKFQDARFKSADTAPRGTNSSQKATLIDEAKNFYRVDERLFRSAQLDGSDAAKLHELGIKSIVNLRHFSRGGDKRAFGDQFWLANKPLQSWEIKPAQRSRTSYAPFASAKRRAPCSCTAITEPIARGLWWRCTA